MSDDQTTRPRVDAGPDRELRAGAVLGRYVAVRFIGAGGNGEVWAAYDQVLRRTVALKVLHAAEAGDDGWADLLDEAQSLARLSHPNVVTVHDVGRHGARVFISMELVDGVDLRRWLDAEPPPWRERVAVMLAAGEGLAAAHEAGLVHGDFKPANVLIDADGSARVVDFGLARVERSQSHEDGSSAAGTPRYMAPEQHDGGSPTAASDQYAFAVATFEALAGHPPFGGETEADVAQAKRGDPDAEASAKLPAPVRSVLARALRPNADARWPNIKELLAALRRAARPKSRVAPLALLGTVAAVGIGWIGLRQDAERCEDRDDELSGVWDETTRNALRDAFARSDQPWAADVGNSALAGLDAYARQWVAASRALCEQRRAPDEAYALRRFCLDANRAALQTATELLAADDEDSLRRAVEIVQGIPSAGSCLDIEVRAPRASPPAPSELADIEAVQAELARLRVLRAAGHYDDALVRAEALVAQAVEVGDVHDAAMAQLEVGDLRRKLDRDDATAALHESLRLALASGRDDVVAKAAASIAWGSADATELETARWWLGHAEAAASAAGGSDELSAYVLNARSHVHGVAGERDAELDAARGALEAVRATSGPQSERVAVISNTLAISLYRAGDYAEASTHSERAVDIIEASLGPHHPRWSTFALTLAGIRISQGRHVEAAELLGHAHAAALASFGPEHPNTLTIASGLAMAHSYTGAFTDAARLHRDVLKARLAKDGEDAPRHGHVADQPRDRAASHGRARRGGAAAGGGPRRPRRQARAGASAPRVRTRGAGRRSRGSRPSPRGAPGARGPARRRHRGGVDALDRSIRPRPGQVAARARLE